ncbi:hypothetical protein [Paenibacillus ihuae]|uniref:hypothetical protein n=1 Tax=Paenibacillus ihuae TaxID=1232431 RepID=UPI000B325EC7|nr:hypothetical protein [Paenibacillus ihuae]
MSEINGSFTFDSTVLLHMSEIDGSFTNTADIPAKSGYATQQRAGSSPTGKNLLL